VRSQIKEGKGIISTGTKTKDREYDFVKMINSALPEDIKVLSWAPVDCTFNARYAAKSRTYLYLFLQEDLDIELMRKAGKQFEGVHDFSNFCKKEEEKENYVREIFNFDIILLNENTTRKSANLYAFKIKGSGFLWHQIRFISSILFLIGKGLEKPDVILQLLDVVQVPNKPNYPLASEIPLILYDAEYEGIEFECEKETSIQTFNYLYQFWKEQYLKSSVILTMLQSLKNDELPESNYKHTPIFKIKGE